MPVFLAADHAGFDLKEHLRRFLTEEGYDVEDCGAFEIESGDDYPAIAARAIEKMCAFSEHARAILVCGSGVGMAIAANRYSGVRAVQGWSRDVVRSARRDEDANVLTLAARFIDNVASEEIVRMFLEEPFSKEQRHVRRIALLDQIKDQ